MADAAPASNAPLPPDTAPTAAPPRRSRWRIARTIVLCLLLGAIMNIAVAWSLAAWLPQRGWYGRFVGGRIKQRPPLHVWNFRTLGACRRSWDDSGSDIMTPSRVIDRPRFSTTWGGDEALAGIRWGDVEQVRMSDHPKPRIAGEHATGFPLLTGWYRIAFQSSAYTFAVADGIPLNAPLNARMPAWQLRALPLRPIWPGIIINPLFYAALSWSLWLIPLTLRRVLRRRRNLCIRCGYSRAGIAPDAACPECGAR